MATSMTDSFCLFFSSSYCLTMAEWKDVAVIFVTYVTIPGVLFAAYKTFKEVQKLREEKERERWSRIHAQQLEALRNLYEPLDRMQVYAQLMTKVAIFDGEKPEEYPGLLQKALTDARREFVAARLLLSEDLVQQIEAFFQTVTESQIHLAVALRTMSGGAQRAGNLEKAGEISHKVMPQLLKAIEHSARTIIHGETRAQ